MPIRQILMYHGISRDGICFVCRHGTTGNHSHPDTVQRYQSDCSNARAAITRSKSHHLSAADVAATPGHCYPPPIPAARAGNATCSCFALRAILSWPVLAGSGFVQTIVRGKLQMISSHWPQSVSARPVAFALV